MRYGLIPGSPGERLALALGRVPVPVFDALGTLLTARSLMAAVRLGIFEALRAGPLEGAALAAARGLDAPATLLLLRTLVCGRYLREARGRFALSPLARRSLLRGAPGDLTGYLEWNYRQWEMLEGLEELLRGGKGVDFHRAMSGAEEWAAYLRAMLELARLDAPLLAARVPVRAGARRLLDLGGGHGWLGAAICRRHPPLRSTVIDLEAALKPGRDLAREAGIAELVEHRAADLRSAELGRDVDVALLANLLHHLSAEESSDLLGRVRRALARGGTIALWELEAPPAGSRPSLGDAVALFFRLSSSAHTASGEELCRSLARAGFDDLRLRRPRLRPGAVLVTGRA